MNIVSEVVDAMQEVLNEKAEILGRVSGFIKRQRKLSGGGFAQTLVFTWLSNADATIEELSQTAATLGISISAQGIDKRFTPEGTDFMHQVLLICWMSDKQKQERPAHLPTLASVWLTPLS
jgi:hypothetical protein